MAAFTTNTGSTLNGPTGAGRTASGLSTQIIIRVGNQPVGALQSLQVSQARPLARVKEIGTDGVIEIVPQGATTFELSVSRIVFDQLRLPEAFSRGFRFINAQRLPFDIDVYDITSVNTLGSDPTGAKDTVIMTYKNCWFSSYSTPYASENYLITENATIWAETAFVSSLPTGQAIPANALSLTGQTDAQGIEMATNAGGRLGSMDASGIWNSLFSST